MVVNVFNMNLLTFVSDVKRVGDCRLRADERSADNDGESKTLPSLAEVSSSQPGFNFVLKCQNVTKS